MKSKPSEAADHYEVILLRAGRSPHSGERAPAQEALTLLLKNEIAVVLMDVCMPELDGFQLAQMIREHPRFRQVAMIFISAVHLAEIDHLRGYEMGAVDYVPVPVVPEVLRAKVRVFADLYRKTRQLEQLNVELERRVAQRTAELEASTRQLMESEQRRSLALAAGQMGSWDWNLVAEPRSIELGTKGLSTRSTALCPSSSRRRPNTSTCWCCRRTAQSWERVCSR